MAPPRRILVVGGSLAGLSFGLSALRAARAAGTDAEVRVVDRSRDFRDRGSGMSMTEDVLERLFGGKLAPTHPPRNTPPGAAVSMQLLDMQGNLKAYEFEAGGHILATSAKPVKGADLSYGSFRNAILKDFLDAGGVFTAGRNAVGVSRSENGPEVQFDDGSVEHADLLVVADGFRSQLRKLLLADESAEAVYKEYMLFRAIMERESADPATLAYFSALNPAAGFLWFETPKYPYMVFRFAPPAMDDSGHVPEGAPSRIEISLYINDIGNEEFQKFMLDRFGTRHEANTYAGQLSEWAAQRLLDEAEAALKGAPEWKALFEAAIRSDAIAAQGCWEFEPRQAYFPSLPAVLLGDAFAAAAPSSGQGAAKGIREAVSLAEALFAPDSDAALKEWEERAIGEANRVIAVGRAKGAFWRARAKGIPPVRAAGQAS
ncbi:hypothetical protein DFJ74DRAFT_708906 [Hyaloraphidium curvatum]|nr:hypothetical protein DFJ74DRAFT_708906 [Hyaloraphidium curvatum]